MAQAIKGGEIGVNGEFYKGGQFMANSENTVKGAQKRDGNGGKRTGRVEIERGVWAERIAGKQAIYGLFGVYLSESNGVAVVNQQACDWAKTVNGGNDITATMLAAAKAWNSGERWI